MTETPQIVESIITVTYCAHTGYILQRYKGTRSDVPASHKYRLGFCLIYLSWNHLRLGQLVPERESLGII